MLVVLMLLSGCTSPDVDQPVLIGEELEGVENPCSQPTEPLAQSNTILNVGGVDRMFRLSIPSSDAGTELPILLAFHGEDMAEEEFPQQASFDALGEEHGFIMAYAVSEQGRTAAEGDWFLNTAKQHQQTTSTSPLPSWMRCPTPIVWTKPDCMQPGTLLDRCSRMRSHAS